MPLKEIWSELGARKRLNWSNVAVGEKQQRRRRIFSIAFGLMALDYSSYHLQHFLPCPAFFGVKRSRPNFFLWYALQDIISNQYPVVSFEKVINFPVMLNAMSIEFYLRPFWKLWVHFAR